MTNDRKTIFVLDLLAALSEASGKTVGDFARDLWVESMLALNDTQFLKATHFLKRCFKEQRMPRIIDVEEHAKGALSGDDEAQTVVDSIAAAISRYGLPNESEARRFIGEMGWHVVQRLGGWHSVCSIESYKDLAINKAQWKQTVKAVQKARDLGIVPPGLPERRDEGLQSAKQVFLSLVKNEAS